MPDTPDTATAGSAPLIPQEVQEMLRNAFGFEQLRAGQDAVVSAVMQGRDALAIMPTGGGKSLCY